MSFLQSYTHLVDFSQKSLLLSACAIAFNPTAWNIVARKEYRTRFLTKFFGSGQAACYFLAISIFSLGLVRDFLYERALRAQPSHQLLEGTIPTFAGYALLACGNILVISSTWQLGITGTFLGDYCGILMDDIVTGFPFNITNAPMYYGSTMSFLGTALLYGKPAGILITAEVLLVYLIAIQYENPFTAGIYAKREQERAKAGGKKVEEKKEL
ncbi:phospholipid methyltransferase-domain-containing protein [Podospora appendiculata]|uniref:Phosphatidyl-N-methylethanolamine N-methyltransferase n=1 Tax=Podospora appendiculata TaxID=314037 RepID=A0AAE1C879_9PEZI|nr:phospholipid methyltransferase-domain-containing protein [Podospora appendiculata]